jgi:hypothetical protein
MKKSWHPAANQALPGRMKRRAEEFESLLL